MVKILVIAAHPDDEILGVAGTILKHAQCGDEVSVCIVTKAHEPQWSKGYMSRKTKEAKKVDALLGIRKRYWAGLETARLNTVPTDEVTSRISKIVKEAKPDRIYTHFWGDVHSDHRTVFQAVMVAARPAIGCCSEVFCFETVSSTEWSAEVFRPNHYTDITLFIEKKLEAFRFYKSEVKRAPHPRSIKGLKTLAAHRGSQVCLPFAEAFQIVRSYG